MFVEFCPRTSCQTDYLKYRGVDDPENKVR